MTIKLAHSHSAIKMFENCPKQYNHVRIAKDVKDSMGEAALWGVRVHEELEHRLRDKTPLPEGSDKFEDLVVAFENLPGEVIAEQEFTLNKDLEPTGWWDKDAWLRAKLDVMVSFKTQAVIGDWKTGKRRPDFSQMDLFAIMVFKHYPEIENITASFVWLKDKKLDTKKYQRSDVPNLWNNLLTRIHRIEAAADNNIWPAKPSGLCPWCAARDICEYA